MKKTLKEVASNLLVARQQLERVEAELREARRAFASVEAEYLTLVSENETSNVVLAGVIIMPKNDWYDEPSGQRVEFRQVEVL